MLKKAWLQQFVRISNADAWALRLQRNLLLTCFILINFISLNAQEPCFYTNDTIGCAPFTVTIRSCVSDPSIPKAYSYIDGGTPVANDSVHTYTEPGYYSVTQYIQVGVQLKDSTITNLIRVVDIPEPQFKSFPCINREVQFYIEDTTYDAYALDYGDGSLFDTVFSNDLVSHIYSDSLTKTATLTGFYYNAPCTNSKSISVEIHNIYNAPEITQLTETNKNSSSGSLGISAISMPHINTKSFSNINDGTFSQTDSTYGLNYNATFTNLNTESNRYCYFLSAQDICGTQLNTDTICHIPFNVTAENERNTLSFTNNNVSIDIKQNSSNIYSGTESSYIDSNINCNNNYCYQINAYNGKYSSAEICVDAIFNTPPTLPNYIHSTQEVNQTILFWDNSIDNLSNLEVYYSIDNTTYTSYANNSISGGILETSIPLASSTNYYKIVLTNNCGVSSTITNSTYSQPIYLVATKNDNSIDLSWNNYQSENGSVVNSYTVEWLDENDTPITSFSTTGTSYTINSLDTATKSLIFRITANLAVAASKDIYSNIVEVSSGASFYFPNAFSPNGDGLNDVFRPVFKYIESYQIYIYDQYGKVLYESTEPSLGWDGTFNGKQCPQTSYIYKATVVDEEGRESKVFGNVTLLR